MTWTRLDADFPQHPKIIAAGERAVLLHIYALIYCNRFLTDGKIPKVVVATLTRHAKADAPRLVELGIWVEMEQEYEIHDFLEYQPSKANVLAKRKQKASAGQAGGLARARNSLQHPANPVPVPVPVGSLDPRTSGDKGTSADNSVRVGTSSQGTNGAISHVSESFAPIMAKLKARVQ